MPPKKTTITIGGTNDGPLQDPTAPIKVDKTGYKGKKNQQKPPVNNAKQGNVVTKRSTLNPGAGVYTPVTKQVTNAKLNTSQTKSQISSTNANSINQANITNTRTKREKEFDLCIQGKINVDSPFGGITLRDQMDDGEINVLRERVIHDKIDILSFEGLMQISEIICRWPRPREIGKIIWGLTNAEDAKKLGLIWEDVQDKKYIYCVMTTSFNIIKNDDLLGRDLYGHIKKFTKDNGLLYAWIHHMAKTEKTQEHYKLQVFYVSNFKGPILNSPYGSPQEKEELKFIGKTAIKNFYRRFSGIVQKISKLPDVFKEFKSFMTGKKGKPSDEPDYGQIYIEPNSVADQRRVPYWIPPQQPPPPPQSPQSPQYPRIPPPPPPRIPPPPPPRIPPPPPPRIPPPPPPQTRRPNNNTNGTLQPQGTPVPPQRTQTSRSFNPFPKGQMHWADNINNNTNNSTNKKNKNENGSTNGRNVQTQAPVQPQNKNTRSTKVNGNNLNNINNIFDFPGRLPQRPVV